MKILVSDYDDTFYINDDDIKKNIVLVKEFMKNNCFAIATGRSYLDYEKKKDLYGIACNYLIINHGATILKDDLIIYNIAIDNALKDELIKDLKTGTTIRSFACSNIDSRVSLDSENLTKIHVMYNTKAEAEKIKNHLDNKYSNKINCFLVCKNEAIEIVAKEVNKSKAIKYVSKLEGIEEKDIYTIGDSYSDIEMIKTFNGYAMTNSIKELKEVAIKEYDSVSTLISDIMSADHE